MEQDARAGSPLEPERRERKPLRTALFVFVAALALGLAGFAMWDRSEPALGAGLIFRIPEGSENRVLAGEESAVQIPTRIIFSPGGDKITVVDQNGEIIVTGGAAAITVINEDRVTHRAGPFLVGPGMTFTQRFPTAGDYPITCTVDDAESILVTVR
jgi:plastocyanin